MANQDDQNPAEVQQRAREHRENAAKIRAAFDQGAEGAKGVAQLAASYWLSLVEQGVPESYAVYITTGYIDTLLRPFQPNQQPPQQDGGR